MELTGQSGHFWLDFEKESDAQEWWSSMQSLNIAKNRSSFTPYVSQSTDSRISRTDTETSLSYSSMSKHAPVKILPNSSRASSTVPLHSSSSPPPIKPSQSSATLTSTGRLDLTGKIINFSFIFILSETDPAMPWASYQPENESIARQKTA